MKKINKLLIAPERLIKHEELSKISGGYDACCMCYGGFPIERTGYMLGTTHYNCDSTCREVSGNWYGIWECII
jgi:hypothetical protein